MSNKISRKAQAWIVVIRRARILAVFLIVGLFAIVGFALIQMGNAATSSISIEAEAGQRAGNATVATGQTGASGGQAVKFAGSTGGGGGTGEPVDSIGKCTTDTTGDHQVPANSGVIWNDEFNGNAVSYAADGGTWRTKGYEAGGSLNDGYNDFAASNRNVSTPESKKYGFATVTNGTLNLKAKRAVDVPGVQSGGKRWLGVYLVTDHNKNLTWRYGYYEWRMRNPTKTRGMFPTLFMFNNKADKHGGYEGAELDMIEVFGSATGSPWYAGVHFNPNHLNGVEGHNVATVATETANWHRYSINWTPDSITFARDGETVGNPLTGAEAAWYRNADMGIRMNYSMDPPWMNGKADHSTETDPARGLTLCSQIDYVRVYAQKPANLPGGPNDPY